ncbi:hypothetical protein EDB85DRAFT_1990911 [Lactarius pseudohatsudake]|nr:hypothetical protein EDB85DRAFT_1990911 [Lactarius pseudohatsudake]
MTATPSLPKRRGIHTSPPLAVEISLVLASTPVRIAPFFSFFFFPEEWRTHRYKSSLHPCSALFFSCIWCSGMVFDHVAGDVQVFPSVGLRHSTESVRVNFGHTPFKYDIDDHVQQRRDTI